MHARRTDSLTRSLYFRIRHDHVKIERKTHADPRLPPPAFHPRLPPPHFSCLLAALSGRGIPGSTRTPRVQWASLVPRRRSESFSAPPCEWRHTIGRCFPSLGNESHHSRRLPVSASSWNGHHFCSVKPTCRRPRYPPCPLHSSSMHDSSVTVLLPQVLRPPIAAMVEALCRGGRQDHPGPVPPGTAPSTLFWTISDIISDYL